MSISRREFLKHTFYTGLVGISAGYWGIPAVVEAKKKKHARIAKSKVVIIRNDKLRNKNKTINQDVVEDMLQRGMKEIFKKHRNPWAYLFNSKDIVGIKVNANAGYGLSSHPELVNGIINGLVSAGVKLDNIIVWDRTVRELKRAGFKINITGKGVKCYGTDMVGYTSEPIIIRSVGSCFSNILFKIDKLINVCVLKDHGLAGVSLSLKNHFGSIHNPNKFHDNNCDPYIADLNCHPLIKDKTRLIICDAINAQYNGGPAFKPQWMIEYNSLIISTDTVALDYVGMRIIEKMRSKAKMPSLNKLGRHPKHIFTAGDKEHRLGKCRDDEIILKRIRYT